VRTEIENEIVETVSEVGAHERDSN
jgi:hypothetical protein